MLNVSLTVTRDRVNQNHHVWIAGGSLIGSERTRCRALVEAEITLLRALDAVRVELIKEGVIQETARMKTEQEAAVATDETPTTDQADGAGASETPADVAHDDPGDEDEKAVPA